MFWIIKQRLKRLLEQSPSLFVKILKFRYRNNNFINRIVDDSTDIVIEGFPRSSNSFAVQAFRRSQQKDVKIATHTHSHAQIIEAVRLDKPTLVLIRKPADCIISLKALELEANHGDDALMKRMKISEFIRWYIIFYTSLQPYKNKFVLAQFEEITTDFGKVAEKINQKYHTSFNIFNHTKDAEKEIFNSAGFHLSPSDKRDIYKKQIEVEYYSDENKALRLKAENVYNLFIKK
jgi:hypothetical protein